MGAVAALLAAPTAPSAFLRVVVEPPLLREEAERPVPVAFSLAAEARWLALRLAVLALDLADEVRLPLEEDEVLLPPRTFCAASATASAISEPSLPTLLAIEVAALVALSAASRPASRILRRTDGLALIAAAAAARPAASISLLIAALASLSNVSLIELLSAAPLSLLAELLLPLWLLDLVVLARATISLPC